MKHLKKNLINKFSYLLIIVFIAGAFPSILPSGNITQATNSDDSSNTVQEIIDDSTPLNSTDLFTDQGDNNVPVNEKISTSSLNPKFGERVWEFCRTCYENEVIRRIKFSPNMKLLAAGTDSGKIHIFDVINGVELYTLGNSNGMIESLAWSKNSSILVSLFKDSILNYWNIENRSLDKQINFASKISEIRSFTISNDGTKLAIASYDGKISLWTFDGKFLSYILENHQGLIIDLQFSNNGSLLASFSSTGKVWVWSLNTFNLLLNSSITMDTQFSLSFYRGNAIAFSSNDDLLFVSLDQYERMIAFDISTKSKLTNLIPVDDGGILHTMVNSVSQDKSKNVLAYVTEYCSGCGSSHVTLYDYTKNKTILNLEGEELTIEFSQDASMLAVLTREELITIYNTVQNSEIIDLSGHSTNVYSTKFLNETLFASADTNSVKIWKNNMLLKSIEDSRISLIAGLAITENSKKDILVSFGGFFNNIKGYIFIYNLTSDFLNIYYTNTLDVILTDFSPNSSLLVTTDSSKINIWTVDPFVSINEINLPLEGGYTFSKGFSFITDMTIIGSSGITGKIFLWDINGTLITTYQLTIEAYIIGIKLSADKTILAMELAHGFIAYLNLTNGEHYTKTLPNFASTDWSGRFSDVVVSPDNRYIIGISGFIHTLFIVDIKDLSLNGDLQLKANLPLDVKSYLLFDMEPNTWTVAVGKSDYKVGIFDLSYIRDGKIDSFDFDCDGIPDSWENSHGMDSGKYWDRFEDPDLDQVVNWEEYLHHTNPLSKDTDNDTITDTYEVEYGLNATVDDSLLDIDGDGMNNLYEFTMGLDSSINDSYLDPDKDGLTNLQEFHYWTNVNNPDTDSDGMPDKWEVDNHLNPISNTDKSKDYDFDGIANIDEFRAGTDPNDFFSFPLLSINNFYIISVLLASIISLFSYIEYRRYITNKYIAPDYASALKVKKSGLDSWYDFIEEEQRIELQLKSAKSLFLEGFIDRSITMYYSLLDNLKMLSKDMYVAETLVRILFISQKMQKNLSIDYKRIYEKFPIKNRNNLVQNYYNILQAYEYETKNNPGLAIELLNKVYSSNLLPSEFSLITFYSIIDLMIEQTQSDKSKALSDSIQSKLLLLRNNAQKANLFEFVCGSYILQARASFYNYKLDEAIDYLETVTNTATKKHLYYFIEKTTMEIKEFNSVKSTIKQRLSLTEESIVTLEKDFDKYKEQMFDYAKRAKEIIEKEELEET